MIKQKDDVYRPLPKKGQPLACRMRMEGGVADVSKGSATNTLKVMTGVFKTECTP